MVGTAQFAIVPPASFSYWRVVKGRRVGFNTVEMYPEELAVP